MIVQIFLRQRLFFGTIEHLPCRLTAWHVVENEEMRGEGGRENHYKIAESRKKNTSYSQQEISLQ
jgi:hypothetical protein